MTFEHRFEGCKAFNHGRWWGRKFWTKETASAISLKEECVWGIIRKVGIRWNKVRKINESDSQSTSEGLSFWLWYREPLKHFEQRSKMAWHFRRMILAAKMRVEHSRAEAEVRNPAAIIQSWEIKFFMKEYHFEYLQIKNNLIIES